MNSEYNFLSTILGERIEVRGKKAAFRPPHPALSPENGGEGKIIRATHVAMEDLWVKGRARRRAALANSASSGFPASALLLLNP